MDQKNDLFWAFIVAIICASVLSALAFIFPRSDRAIDGIDRIADGLVTGALGFFAGHASNSSPTAPVEPAPKE